MSCSEICATDDGVCVDAACRGATAYGWSVRDEVGCWEAVEGSMNVLDVGCDDPIDFSDPRSELVQCCCDFPGN